MTAKEVDELIVKLDRLAIIHNDIQVSWHIKGIRDTLKQLQKDPNTAETMNLTYLKKILKDMYPKETF